MTSARKKYSPALHYMLLNDSGEPKYYENAFQVEDMVKWELLWMMRWSQSWRTKH